MSAADEPIAPRDRDYYPKVRACAWPPRPPPDASKVRIMTLEELNAWTVFEDERLLVINKPGDVVCHPSKAGPWSSLVGAVKEGKGFEKSHLIFRLDRETSGVVLFAKDERMASRLQKAMQAHKIRKSYLTILTGHLDAPVTVDQPLGDDMASPVFIKTCVRPDGKPAVTHFEPVSVGNGFTFSRVRIETGRKHQIRAHAQWIGHMVVGDKIYGPDACCYLDFIDRGYTPELAAKLLMPRQALHCAEIDLRETGLDYVLTAPLADDLVAFCSERGILTE